MELELSVESGVYRFSEGVSMAVGNFKLPTPAGTISAYLQIDMSLEIKHFCVFEFFFKFYLLFL